MRNLGTGYAIVSDRGHLETCKVRIHHQVSSPVTNYGCLVCSNRLACFGDSLPEHIVSDRSLQVLISRLRFQYTDHEYIKQQLNMYFDQHKCDSVLRLCVLGKALANPALELSSIERRRMVYSYFC